MSFVRIKMYIRIVFVLVATVSYCHGYICDAILVKLPQGTIDGITSISGNGKEYYSFQEIPYAAPPIDKLRFKEPQPPTPWTDIRETCINKKVCMQKNESALTHVPSDMTISEDCLYLNVYTPQKPGTSEQPLPVLFYIHGGGFFYGSGARQYHEPKYFMDYDVVVVTFNYRLGPFGFLTTADDVIPGNLGLKDQLYALKWTVENINLFGGDADKITVVGESAGATSAGFMQLSKRTEGLARAYILQSGSPVSPFAYQDAPREYAFKMGKLLDSNFNSNDSVALLNLLMDTPAEKIQAAPIQNVGHTINPIGALAIWLPVIEDPTFPNSFITEPMVDSLLSGNYNKVPLMTGTTSEEAVYFLQYLTNEQLAYFQNMLDSNLNLTVHPRLNINPEQLSQAAKEYKEVYTKTNFSDDAAAYIKYIGEDVFSTPNIHHAALVSKKAPVYFYEFSYRGQMGVQDLPVFPGANNVGHTEDLHYLFGGIEGVSEPLSQFPDEDRQTMKKMLTLWTNFVKTLNPTPVKDELLNNVSWPMMKCGEPLNFLSINRTLVPLVNPKYYTKVKQVLDKYVKPPYYVY
ncbi:juvenile hormone esterase-like isoform X1 [Diorhabda sublineata]|uniref:juvenile hormone esterase-like isoform X1 n=1 Tax=Diorhabda sublineata TaxID=1163346 RepID=UPI0024E06C8D|nr:juvenile hormone esterase-like isoform X1 [Diorhabda sublineata]